VEKPRGAGGETQREIFYGPSRGSRVWFNRIKFLQKFRLIEGLRKDIFSPGLRKGGGIFPD